MILSEDKQTHLAHVIIDGLYQDDLVEYTDEDNAIREAKRAVVDFVKSETSMDETVRNKIATLKRGVLEGSREFDLLYKKYYDEELQRHRR